jgi:peptidoglycan/LPS O-acetylase OafA/YrhL
VLGHTPERAPSFEVMRTDITTSLLASLFYLHGLLFSGPPKLNPPDWSLEIELQFYLVAPALIFAYLSLRHRPARLLLGFAIVLAGTALRLWLVGRYGEYGYFRWTLLNYFPLFMLGIVMADLMQGEEAMPRRRTAQDLLYQPA